MENPWFGESWSELCSPGQKVTTPVGALCADCHEPIESTDSGLMVVTLGVSLGFIPTQGRRPVHLECFTHMSVGGVNHQRRLCPCFGGALPADPPSLTRREAARVAMHHWTLQQRRDRGLPLKFEDLSE